MVTYAITGCHGDIVAMVDVGYTKDALYVYKLPWYCGVWLLCMVHMSNLYVCVRCLYTYNQMICVCIQEEFTELHIRKMYLYIKKKMSYQEEVTIRLGALRSW